MTFNFQLFGEAKKNRLSHSFPIQCNQFSQKLILLLRLHWKLRQQATPKRL